MAEIKKEWLAGLTYRFADVKTVKDDGRPVKRSVPVERPLKAEDVIGVRECGDRVILVAADGRKHEVDPNAKKKAGEEAAAKKKAEEEAAGAANGDKGDK